MTAIADQTDLPDYEGESVAHMQLKFTGVGTGFTGLDVKPVVMELDDEAYFIVRVKAKESASHTRDKNDDLIRVQRVAALDMAPVDKKTAQDALQTYAAEIERAKAELDNQMSLDEEAAALEREKADRGESNMSAKA